MPRVLPPLLASLMLVSAACATPRDRVQRLASGELGCRPEKLRVQSLGELELRGPPLHLRVYHVEGCQTERTYHCREGGGCAARLAALGIDASARAVVARALHLRRTLSRGRCPSDAERLVQESETLYRFEACDRSLLLHCRRHGCEVIGR